MRRTEQKIAETEAKLARLRDDDRKDHARQMILLGAILFAEARHAPGFRLWLIAKLEAATKPANERAICQLIGRIQDQSVRP